MTGEIIMHIPDGYLSPQTTIPAIAGMIPLWSAALRKIKTKLGERRIPQLALCAAFAFVVMMFNVPVGGGSSAHAVGAVFIAIMLGPWAACISVSTALLIQALVFGDGGILAFGVNCFNMAFVMPFTGYAIFRLISSKNSAPGSRRSLTAAAVGSYAGLNIAAFCASVEFGIQPLLFRAADGTALYCPYPLSVSIPAMMSAHLLVAGPIEAVITAAAIAYATKFAPSVFVSSQNVISADTQQEIGVSFFKRCRAIIIPAIVIVALTPLGLIAAGTAWGEWGSEDIKAALGYIPSGFAAAADKWRALLPDYSVPLFGFSAAGSAIGYVLCAVIGIALIAAIILLTSVIVSKASGRHARENER